MKHFTAMYMMPVQGLDDWMAKPEEERKAAETQMKKDWDKWVADNSSSILNTISVGKPKKISASGIEDSRNSIMMSSYVQAEDLDAAAGLFKNHPHLQIPGATIEVMESTPV